MAAKSECAPCRLSHPTCSINQSVIKLATIQPPASCDKCIAIRAVLSCSGEFSGIPSTASLYHLNGRKLLTFCIKRGEKTCKSALLRLRETKRQADWEGNVVCSVLRKQVKSVFAPCGWATAYQCFVRRYRLHLQSYKSVNWLTSQKMKAVHFFENSGGNFSTTLRSNPEDLVPWQSPAQTLTPLFSF